MIFLWLSWLAVLLVGAYARRDDDDGVAQHGGQSREQELTGTEVARKIAKESGRGLKKGGENTGK